MNLSTRERHMLAGGSVIVALVILLNGEPGQAITLLRKLDDDSGKSDYLMAVAAARQGDVEIMYNALRAAVAKKPDIKKHAAMDVEFYEYFEEDLFKEITQ